MNKQIGKWFVRFYRLGLGLILLSGVAAVIGCSKPSDAVPPSLGVFTDSAVSGLNYKAASYSGTTTSDGSFFYVAGETVTFSIGDVALGAAKGIPVMTPWGITAGAASASDEQVNNKLIFLQTLDVDGNFNNGIQITDGIRAIVSANAASINFNQTTAAFRTSLSGLMTALNAANVFTDTDPRPRTVRGAAAALEHFTRSTAERYTVNTVYGPVRGYAADAATWQFLGVPYAQPPLGDLRWRPPQEPTPWTGVRDAVAWSDQAAQNQLLERFGEGGMSEDCLYLNVTTPKGASGLPVMVWFHGGAFTALTSNTKDTNNPAALTTKGVVLVSVNHRLGAFGYMAHPLLSRESEYGGSGNYGQMDLIMALKWVKNNIAHFGGDPNNVTIFGESGGGRKVLSLMASPLAAGLFHKAISESGSLVPDSRSLAKAESIGQTVTDSLGVTTLAQMRAVSWMDLVTAAGKLTGTSIPYVNVDGYYLPDTERVLYETHRHNDVPFMIVVNNQDEPSPIETLKNVFPWMSDYTSRDYFACLFTKSPSGWAARGVGAYHTAELLYVFNYPLAVIPHYQLRVVIDPVTGSSLVIGDLNGNGITGSAGDTEDIWISAGWNAEDAAVADTTMTVWTNFAKTGNPSITGFTWPAYTRANDTYVELGTALTVKTGLSSVFP